MSCYSAAVPACRQSPRIGCILQGGRALTPNVFFALSRLNPTLSRLPEHACCLATQWLMPPVRMAAQFPHVPDALENSVRIAEACHSDWSFRDTIFPAFRGLTDEGAWVMLQEKTYAGSVER